MQRVQLGGSGLSIPRVVLGMADPRAGASDPSARVRTIHAAIDAGMDALDTAPLYEFGGSERLVGRAIAGRRDRVLVMTKVGLSWDGEHGEVLFRSDDRVVRRDGRPASVRRDVEGSLQRMGIETIDVCQVHHPDVHVPIADTVGTLLRLRDEGKLRAIGVSNFDAAQIGEAVAALGDVPLACHQGELSLLRRAAASGLAGELEQAGIAFLAYSPLALGVLGGRGLQARLDRDDPRRHHPWFHPDNAASIRAAVEGGLLKVARRDGVDAAAVAIAWVLSQPGVTGAVVGCSRPEQVGTTIRAASLTLSAGDREGLRGMFERVHVRTDVRPRRRDQLRDAGQRLLSTLARRLDDRDRR